MPKLVYVDTILDLNGRSAVILGRHRDCDLQVDDGKASRQHCRVEAEGGVWYLVDLDSANGTLLNGRPVRSREKLGHEDIIAIGASRIQVQMPETAEAPVERVRRTQARSGVLGNPDTLIGRDIDGFVLTKVKGRSPVGAVFRADQATLKREAAVTLIAPEALEGVADPQAALTALKAQKLPSDPGLPERYDCGVDAELGAVWIAGAILDGETLGDLAGRGTIGVVEGLLLCERVAKVLQVVHGAGSAYGLLDGDAAILDSEGRVRLRDPGVAAALADVRAGVGTGDPAFRCPEGTCSVQGDLYALGCLLHLLLTGRTPFRAATADAWKAAHRDNPIPSIADLHRTRGADLDRVLQGLLAKNPEWRYHTVDEYLAEAKPLREALAAVPSKVPTPSPAAVQRAAERATAQRQSAWKGGITTVVLIALIAGGGWMLLSRMGAPEAPVSSSSTDGGSRAGVPMMGGMQRRDPPLPSERPRSTPETATPSPTPPADTAPTTGTTAPVVDLAAARRAIEADMANGDFGAAELAVRDLLAAHPGDGDLIRLSDRVRREGLAWYQQRIDALPTGSAIGDLLETLRSLQRLQDTALAQNRGDATARVDEAVQRLGQRLAVARRDARILVEEHRSAELAALRDRIAGQFRGAPPLGDLRRLIAQCDHAAGLDAAVPGATWAEQVAAAEATTGAARLAIAAACFLVGDDARATALLAHPSLASGDLVRGREALQGREAALLSFDHPADLQSIETILGEPRLAGGALDGAAGAPVSFACTVPIGGGDWEVHLSLHLANASNDRAELRLACRTQDREDLSAHLDGDHLNLRVRGEGGWAEQTGQRPSTGPLRLRLVCRQGDLTFHVGDEERFTVRQARVARGAKVVIEIGGAVWKLDDLMVVGG